LVVLQTYKSSGNNTRGQKWYEEYSAVSDYFLKVREIVIAKKKPRRLELNNNLIRHSETSIEHTHYPETFDSIILSFAERYPFTKELYDQVKNVWDEHKSSLKVE